MLTEHAGDDVESIDESVPARDALEVESDAQPEQETEAAESLSRHRDINGAVRRRPTR
jgi:hypothetical protein